MVDGEGCDSPFWFTKALRVLAGVGREEFVGEVRGSRGGEAALFVEQVEDTHLAFEQVKHILQKDKAGNPE